jgi:hypothetical protein
MINYKELIINKNVNSDSSIEPNNNYLITLELLKSLNFKDVCSISDGYKFIGYKTILLYYQEGNIIISVVDYLDNHVNNEKIKINNNNIYLQNKGWFYMCEFSEDKILEFIYNNCYI